MFKFTLRGVVFHLFKQLLLLTFCIAFLLATIIYFAVGRASALPNNNFSRSASLKLNTTTPILSENAKRYRTDHYIIHTELPQDRVIPIGRHVDQMFEQYEKRFKGLIASQHRPMPIYLFDSESDYIRFLAKYNIHAHNSGGMFVYKQNLKCLALWIGDKPMRDVKAVLQHEGFHQFTWNYIGNNLPVWMNEGLAQYFEDAVITDGTLRTGLADINRTKLVKLMVRSNHFLPFPAIMDMSHDDWSKILSSDPDQASRLYAQAWSMVYFLIHHDDGRNASNVNKYLAALNSGDNPKDSFEEIFSSDRGHLQRQWQRFALTMRNDPVSEAAERMQYLSVALRHFQSQNITIPRNIDKLQHLMRRFGIEVSWTSNNTTQTITANDPRLYTFKRNGLPADFILLASPRDNMPPRILAKGLTPEPMLIWHQTPTGQITPDIIYR
ncbi:hypothetical protein KS4_10260 [Poriferisphaera corsica]|uniref:DUF1570 domain-containing protein n=1 Tax=Poriferisphaera corsica TaxID=2528020 RepID=A0A517YRY1_9BACT|nr:DUF1570 domain-containing protein [Poriferisphaera corsica]QDU32987.1 hypothetical protein KS4_10260 [Poriferisphaera corsica]